MPPEAGRTSRTPTSRRRRRFEEPDPDGVIRGRDGGGKRLQLAPLPLPQLRDLVRKLPPYLPGLPTFPRVVAKLIGLGLAVELAVVLEPSVIQLPRFDRRPHRAARLGTVAAVAKSTAVRESSNLHEGGFQSVVVHKLQLAHPRRIDHQAAAGQED